VAEDRSDEDLIQRFLRGDSASFSVLVRRHERRVHNLCYRMLGREEDARDAAQDAFLTALRKLSSFRGEARFTTWMHRVTVNACYDILRRKKREPVLEGPRDEDAPEPPGPASPDHADSAVAAVDVQRALVKVPQEFRAVLVLHDVQDMAYEDIAEVLGIPVGTVKSRLHRGRVALAQALGGTFGSPGPPDEGDTAEAPGPGQEHQTPARPSKDRLPE